MPLTITALNVNKRTHKDILMNACQGKHFQNYLNSTHKLQSKYKTVTQLHIMKTGVH